MNPLWKRTCLSHIRPMLYQLINLHCKSIDQLLYEIRFVWNVLKDLWVIYVRKSLKAVTSHKVYSLETYSQFAKYQYFHSNVHFLFSWKHKKNEVFLTSLGFSDIFMRVKGEWGSKKKILAWNILGQVGFLILILNNFDFHLNILQIFLNSSILPFISILSLPFSLKSTLDLYFKY